MVHEHQTVGTRIRARRLTRGLTQDQLAMACGVSRSAVAQWETDRAGQVRGNISRIAQAHGERLDDSMTGDEMALLRLYRLCEAEDRAFLLRTARKLAQPAPVTPDALIE
jgi:transcriptional regulator with XRE-family HTH domain